MQYFSVSRYKYLQLVGISLGKPWMFWPIFVFRVKQNIAFELEVIFFFYCWAFVFDSLEKSKITNFFFFFPQKRTDSFPVNFGLVNDYIGIFWNILSQ